MGVTAIVSFNNRSTSSVTVDNKEHPADNVTIPGLTENFPCNMWIPWCTSTKDYPAHHIAVISFEPDTDVLPFFIWQDGDHVRFSWDNQYHPNGTFVPGDSVVNGNRSVTIQNGTFSFAPHT